MSKLVKIKDVHLYTGFTESVGDCYIAMKLLRASGVQFNFLNFSDQDEHHKANFTALSTWNFGADAHKKEFTDYPILVWDECFDDWGVYRRAAHGLQEIKDSDVLKYPELQLKVGDQS